jgi:hypothetical protein
VTLYKSLSLSHSLTHSLTHQPTHLLTHPHTRAHVFSVTVFTALLGDGFQRRTFLYSRVHDLADWWPPTLLTALSRLPRTVLAVEPLFHYALPCCLCNNAFTELLSCGQFPKLLLGEGCTRRGRIADPCPAPLSSHIFRLTVQSLASAASPTICNMAAQEYLASNSMTKTSVSLSARYADHHHHHHHHHLDEVTKLCSSVSLSVWYADHHHHHHFDK